MSIEKIEKNIFPRYSGKKSKQFWKAVKQNQKN